MTARMLFIVAAVNFSYNFGHIEYIKALEGQTQDVVHIHTTAAGALGRLRLPKVIELKCRILLRNPSATMN